MALALLGLHLMLGVLAGCGSNSSSNNGVASVGGSAGASPSASTNIGGTTEERWLQFAQCLRNQGLDVEDPGPGGGQPKLKGDVPQAKRQDALRACRQYAPGILGSSTLSPQDREKMLKYIQCLRQHGITLADPDPQTGMPQQQDFPKFRNPDGNMRQAQQACADLRPQGFGDGN
jgi:hypothetical protein